MHLLRTVEHGATDELIDLSSIAHSPAWPRPPLVSLDTKCVIANIDAYQPLDGMGIMHVFPPAGVLRSVTPGKNAS